MSGTESGGSEAGKEGRIEVGRERRKEGGGEKKGSSTQSLQAWRRNAFQEEMKSSTLHTVTLRCPQSSLDYPMLRFHFPVYFFKFSKLQFSHL